MCNPTEPVAPGPFYHGTTLAAARSIHREGFRVERVIPDLGRVASGGNLGDGIYVSRSWRTALWFGDVLLRVELARGTRIVDATVPPDPDVIRYLQREFGRAVLKEAPWRAIPERKRLRTTELIALVRHHYRRAWTQRGWARRSFDHHARRLAELRQMLARHGFDGYGDPRDDNGIVIFAGDRVRLRALVGEITPEHLPEAARSGDPADAFASLAEVEAHHAAHGSPRAKRLARAIEA